MQVSLVDQRGSVSQPGAVLHESSSAFGARKLVGECGYNHVLIYILRNDRDMYGTLLFPPVSPSPTPTQCLRPLALATGRGGVSGWRGIDFAP
jgi:hypothetical protein